LLSHADHRTSRAIDEGYRAQRSRALIWISGGARFPYVVATDADA
jgi:hypothetical protein